MLLHFLQSYVSLFNSTIVVIELAVFTVVKVVTLMRVNIVALFFLTKKKLLVFFFSFLNLDYMNICQPKQKCFFFFKVYSNISRFYPQLVNLLNYMRKKSCTRFYNNLIFIPFTVSFFCCF